MVDYGGTLLTSIILRAALTLTAAGMAVAQTIAGGPMAVNVTSGVHEIRWYKDGLVDRTCSIRIPEKGALALFSYSISIPKAGERPQCP